MPFLWQKVPTFSCSSSPEAVSTTTWGRGHCSQQGRSKHPTAEDRWGGGARSYLEGQQQVLSEVPLVDRHLHLTVELSHRLLRRLSPALLQISL